MRVTQVGVVVGVFAGIAAGAALVIWPYALFAEMLLDASALLAIATIVAWIISLFLEKLHLLLQRGTLIAAGFLLGTYIAISVAYFTGYLGNNYPASQQLIFVQQEYINTLNGYLETIKQQLASTKSKLEDASKVILDPNSIKIPSYTVNTSLRLQFDNAGEAQEIRSHNVRWDKASVLQAHEITPATQQEQTQSSPAPQEQPQEQQQTLENVLGSYNNRPFGTSTPLLGCPKCPTCPTCTAYETNTAVLLLLIFNYPVRASEIELGSFGAQLPNHEILRLTNRDGIIIFHEPPKNLALDVTVKQK